MLEAASARMTEKLNIAELSSFLTSHVFEVPPLLRKIFYLMVVYKLMFLVLRSSTRNM